MSKSKRIHFIGHTYREYWDGEKYILAVTDRNTINFISLETGNRWNDPVKLEDGELQCRDFSVESDPVEKRLKSLKMYVNENVFRRLCEGSCFTAYDHE